MKEKNAFTLAEILIVLVVLGTIAAMSIPSLIKGATQAQWKSSYKKAYNTIQNLISTEHACGNLPSSNDKEGVRIMFNALNAYLTIKAYAVPSSLDTIATGDVTSQDDYYPSVSTSQTENSLDISSIDTISPWIITEDNIAYSVVKGEGCDIKENIRISEHSEAIKHSCVVIVVDVNGLNNGPNRVDPKTLTKNAIKENKQIGELTGERFYVYVGLNGASAGSKKYTTTGRIVSDIK